MTGSEPTVLQKPLDDNLNVIMQRFHHTTDLKIRDLQVAHLKASILYIDGLIDSVRLQESVIRPLLHMSPVERELIDFIMASVIEATDVSATYEFQELSDGLIQGKAALLLEGYSKAIIVDVAEWKERGIAQPISERAPRGPILGLTEKMTSNINLLRSFIKTPDLCVETSQLGTLSKTNISILYIDGVVDQEILKFVQKHIDSLKVKYVPESRIVEEALEARKSLFPLSKTAERPDTVATSLYEGRVAILVDGTPRAIIVPSLFMDNMQAPDDYYTKYGKLSNRLIRFFGFFMAIYTPAVFVTITMWHRSEIPDAVAKALLPKGTLLSPIFEMLLLILLFKVLIDITFRLPQSVVLLVSLVGTITIGDSLVKAKLTHPFALIIVAVTFLFTFLIANKVLAAITILRVAFLLIGAFLDFPGIIVGSTLLVFYMVQLKSAGVPYLSPLIPFKPRELKDTLFRGDLKKLLNSKHSYTTEDD
ncbi:spore germination protein [Paenibacillus glycanilyticus]|uniref:Spore germination protein KA n=1 Tax=Paenibacillus glycanilyticus TaxID=126569 RepID=A0ABQ6G8H4_9BACL|nr:spore germination protein [Paenibacillus glycanilyticus]GLX67264.1 spore germination protein KA [Paenibacillus glycanilyticus]